ncbi:hypothetical protein GCM10011367_11650 [Marinicauda pacifica]|nr:hypothetical protein [Marinicauda pacifica]GGE38889.1 hypothetical protein GCM10011367_11650 [Marinicauda pacifica]
MQAMLFCIVFLGFTPRIATERSDSGENRLAKIKELIESSRYSIHDLSRCQARTAGEHYRLNMPFELGLDYGCKAYFPAADRKKVLILEEKPYRYQAAISDLAGFDIETHEADYQVAVRKVRNWLANEARGRSDGAGRILDAYDDFQEWNYERQCAAGFSEDDILDYPTSELLTAMFDWTKAGRPASY